MHKRRTGIEHGPTNNAADNDLHEESGLGRVQPKRLERLLQQRSGDGECLLAACPSMAVRQPDAKDHHGDSPVRLFQSHTVSRRHPCNS